MKRKLLIGSIVLMVCGYAVYRWLSPTNVVPTLEVPEEMTLYSLEFHEVGPIEEKLNGRENFHNNIVLGKMTIDDPQTRAEIWKAVQDGIVKAANTATVACYWPRHGLRVVQNGITRDYVICFYCHNFRIHETGKETIGGKFDIDAKPIMNRLLASRQIPQMKVAKMDQDD